MRCATIFLLLVLPLAVAASVRKHSLTAALHLGVVEMTAASNGNPYFQNALQLELRNTTRDVLQITVDPALIFRPEDTGYQDLVLPGRELLVVLPGKSLRTSVQTFCGKAHALAPRAAIGYAFLHQGDSTMVRVSQYISAHRLFDGLGQAAVWALTDEHNLDGILDPARPGESRDLLAFMIRTTGWQAPEYFRLYRPGTEAGQPVFDRRKLEIVAQFELRLETPKMLSMGVYNSSGKEVQVAFREKPMNPGGYRLLVRFEAEGAAPGTYFLRVTEGGAVLREQRVTVE